MVLALLASGVSRCDLVGVFPCASHCVLDAIARVATPLPGPAALSARLRIVHQQWGFVMETNLAPNAIEDCVDTLCVRGTPLFAGGGRFEIWSLPKILGTTSGGVVWCRDDADAVQLRRLRDERGGGVVQWLLRLLGSRYPRAHLYWQGVEGTVGALSRFQTGEILHQILNWDGAVSDRRDKLNLLWPLAVEWLPRPSTRLPPVVPIVLDMQEATLREWGITSGTRAIERIDNDGNRSLIRVIPVPIHQDVPMPWLVSLAARLGGSALRGQEA